jgi:hypothetical protein
MILLADDVELKFRLIVPLPETLITVVVQVGDTISI